MHASPHVQPLPGRWFIPAVGALAASALSLVVSAYIHISDGAKHLTLTEFAEGLDKLVWLLALLTIITASFGLVRRQDSANGRFAPIATRGVLLAVAALIVMTVAGALRPTVAAPLF